MFLIIFIFGHLHNLLTTFYPNLCGPDTLPEGFLMISNIHIINIGLSVIYSENQCFLQLFIPNIQQTMVSCQTRQTMKVSFLDKIQFFDHINMLLLTESLFLSQYE